MGLKFNREDVSLGAIPVGMIPTDTTSTPAPTGVPNRAVDWGVLPSGQAGYVLTVNADGSIGWGAAGGSGGGMSNPMTTAGDTIYASASGSPATAARLGIGSTGQLLTVVSGDPAWATYTGSTSVATLGTITTGTWTGTTIAIANGGTGATSASAALTALGAAPTASPTFTGAVAKTPTAVTATGGTATLSWSANCWFVVTLASGANTLTLSNIPSGTVKETVVVELIQPSGGATVTWSGPTVTWGAAGTPTLSTTAGYVDVITFINVTTSEVRAAANLGFTF